MKHRMCRVTGLDFPLGQRADLRTELGHINQMIAVVSPLGTPLLRQIKQFGYTITAVIAVVSVIAFMFGRWARDMPFIDIFQPVVSIAVSVIPEGLVDTEALN